MPASQESDEQDGAKAGDLSQGGRRQVDEAVPWRRSHVSACEQATASASDSVRTGLQILGLFSRRRAWWEVGEVARAIDVSPSVAHAQLSAMRRMNLVQEGRKRSFVLGSGPPDPTVAIRAMGIVRLTRTHLVDLQRLAQCPVTLAMLDGTELVVVDRAVSEGSPRLEMTIDLHGRLPAHATALGKVLLAYQPEHREQLLVADLSLRSLTPYTITSRVKLLKELQRVRSRTLAVEDREHLRHRRCIAAPVRGANNLVIAAVGIAISDMDAPLEELVDRHREPILTAAARLSNALRHARVDDLDWPCL